MKSAISINSINSNGSSGFWNMPRIRKTRKKRSQKNRKKRISTIVMTVLMASAVASSLEGVSTRVLPKYLRVNLASDASSGSSCVVPAELPPSTHSRLFARAHSSHSSVI